MRSEFPVLYSFRRCPFAMRARMAVHVSGIACELREVVLRDKAPEFLAASAKGTVPVLVLADGRVIDESLDVMLWALDRHDPDQWLAPPAGDLEEMLALVAVCDGPFKRQLDGYKYAPNGETGTALEARAAGCPYLMDLNARLMDRPYLSGGRITLADMAIFPFVRQFAHVDRGWFDGEAWPKLGAWLDGILASPRFAAIMTKYAKWQAGDLPIVFGGGDAVARDI